MLKSALQSELAYIALMSWQSQELRDRLLASTNISIYRFRGQEGGGPRQRGIGESTGMSICSAVHHVLR